jgi:TRAP-type C4-dicarboxylate transport system permease small subunit
MIRSVVSLAIVVPAYVAAFALAAVVVVMGYEVFSRYVLNAPTYWALEVSTYLLTAIVTLGGAYTLRENAHVGMELFYARMSIRSRRIAQRVSMLCVFLFSAVLVVYGIEEVQTALLFNERSLTPLAMPLAYPLALVPVGAFLLGVQSVELFFFPPTDVHLPASADDATDAVGAP